MSRIGKTIINIPTGVKIEQTGSLVKVVGPKGELALTIPSGFTISINGSQVELKQKENQNQGNLHGLHRSLLNNAVLGVNQGWEKKLKLVGVGYKASTNGGELTINVGFTHPVIIKAPEHMTFTVTDNTLITVSGIDKKQVGEIAAQIRDVKRPEPYKGKGIRYLGELVRKKAGKAVKAAGTA
ncbi:MAG: 50S ribosomal protein L6 [Candidatus Gottesmanbacteria bacterium GW2011_GWA1_34_13]|uniref:Large ribosomal subunit protein uL6 n=1 Tax=Candidatus Gottesmanbacteria bacterium GW2011_GWA1_34_13 TaxID=1618434 RepID=A0A0G0AS02_9BACT|nr:MAG: 50S ribosomal protein L6 [Candidatus Gottesmanbacteria bacterium GW2011_GWA1_34_13]